MKRLNCLWAVVCTWIAITPADASHGRRYFPLKKGNQWILERTTSFSVESESVSVGRKVGTKFSLGNFPGVYSPLWVRYSGNTLYAWSSGLSSWKPFFRFGTSEGTAYSLEGMGDSLNDAALMVKTTKGFINPILGGKPKSALRFNVTYLTEMLGGMSEFTFIRDVGLVHWEDFDDEHEEAGGDYYLRSAQLSGKPYGVVSHTVIEEGKHSQYVQTLPNLKNNVLVINGNSAWKAFYKNHKPWAQIPQVDLSQKTSLVALAGWRMSGGYGVDFEKVHWKYPTFSVDAKVRETQWTGATAMAPTSPYQIVLLDQKVSKASVKWYQIVFKNVATGIETNP